MSNQDLINKNELIEFVEEMVWIERELRYEDRIAEDE